MQKPLKPRGLAFPLDFLSVCWDSSLFMAARGMAHVR